MRAHSLFVYGTLLLPQIVRAVTGSDFPRRPAQLAGFRRCGLHGELFPALIEDPGSSTEGALLEAVGSAALAALDRFEGEGYVRRRVVVCAGALQHGAHVYVLAPALRHRLTGQPWSPERFAGQHLAVYLARCRRFTAGSLR